MCQVNWLPQQNLECICGSSIELWWKKEDAKMMRFCISSFCNSSYTQLSQVLTSDWRKFLYLEEKSSSFSFYLGDCGHNQICPVFFSIRIIKISFLNSFMDDAVAAGCRWKWIDMKNLFFLLTMVWGTSPARPCSPGTMRLFLCSCFWERSETSKSDMRQSIALIYYL